MAGNLKMPQINEVRITGRLTRDPQIRNTTAGEVAEFNLAVDRGFGDRKKSAFFQVNIWLDKAREKAMKELDKGAPVLIEGDLWPEEWTDRDGKKQSKTRITCYRFHRLDWPDDAPRTTTPADEPQGDYSGEEEIPF